MEGMVMVATDETVEWARGLDRLVERIAPRFRRVEPRRRVRAYLEGLLCPVERKNGWPLAENAGDRTPDGVQDFLARMRWDADQVRDDLRGYVVAQLGDADAVLVLDETGFVKKGTKSVGVQRQYSGTAGRIENCQIGVFLGYASRHGHALIDRALYLPEVWAHDPARRGAAGVPENTVFATKPQLGRQMLTRAFAAEVPCRWVTGDSVYGADYALRRCIEKSGRGYVLAVTSRQRLGFKTVADCLEDVPAGTWRRLSAGDGAKGPRLYDWAWLPYGLDAADGWQRGLLIRRKLAQPEAFTFYLTLAPDTAELSDLVRVAGTRWTIEACFEAAKGEVGLDQYEVRSWTGWHRHITLAMLAHGFLAWQRREAGEKAARSGGAGHGEQAGAAECAGDPPVAGAHLAAATPDGRPRPALVALATPASGAGAPVALSPPTDDSRSCAHVRL
jgi:SRSO17 transposase